MPWFRVDDDLSSHPKAVLAGNAALGLWARSGSWCMKWLTDGHLPRDIARSFGTPAEAKRLVDVGMWHTTGHTCDACPQPRDKGGYVFHEFGSRQPSAAELEADRQRGRERVAAHRARRKSARTTPEPTDV